MATTRQNLRRNLSYLMGDFILDGDGSVPTCSAQGGASGVDAVDALLSYYEEDYFNEWFFVLPSGPSGSGTYEVTRVYNFTSATGTLTLEPDASGQIANTQAFELHRYNPAWKHLALNAARLQTTDALALSETDESIIVDNLLTGSVFDSSLTGWTQTAGSWSLETSRTTHSGSSGQSTGSATVSASGADAQLTQNIFTSVNISEMVGKNLRVTAWVFATAASAARIRVTFNGGTSFTDGDYHAGLYEWEGPHLQKIDVAIPDDSTSITIYLEVADGNAAYFQLPHAIIDQVRRYTMPTNFYRGPTMVEMQANMLQPDGPYYPVTWQNPPKAGHLLRITGRRLLSEVTTEAGTMQVSEPEDQILYAHALEWLANSNIGLASGVVRDQFLADRERWRQLAAELRIRSAIKRNPPPYFAEQNGMWYTREEGETLILGFKNR